MSTTEGLPDELSLAEEIRRDNLMDNIGFSAEKARMALTGEPEDFTPYNPHSRLAQEPPRVQTSRRATRSAYVREYESDRDHEDLNAAGEQLTVEERDAIRASSGYRAVQATLATIGINAAARVAEERGLTLTERLAYERAQQEKNNRRKIQ